MSLHVLADHMASKGRNGDSMLVHMTPGEVAGLHALAAKHGGELTINPDTGLPEANFLKKLLPTIIGAGISYFSGGTIDPMTAAAMVGGAETVRTGSLERGLMAGMGAYGGAGLTAGFTGAGANAGLTEALAGSTMDTGAQLFGDVAAAEGSSGQAFNEFLKSNANPATMTGSELASAGAKAIANDPMQFAKDNFKYLAGAATPILADMMVPTTTKMPTDTTPAYIRQKLYDPYTQTYKSLAPVKATDWGSRNFSDAYTNPQTGEMATLQPRTPGMATGGIVALAAGGTGDIKSVEDLYQNILGRAPDAGGLAFWQQGFGDTIDANEIASFKQAAQAELANRSAPEQQILAPNLVNTAGAAAPAATSVTDLYQGILGRAPESADVTNYWQNQFGDTIDANELAQFKTAAQAELDARKAGTTGGGVANLATTGAGTTAGGITNLTGATTGVTDLATARAQVTNMYRNVLGRDPDPEGLAFWSNAIAGGRSPESIYDDFLTSAKANTELVRADQIGAKTFADATTPYTGYISTDSSNIVDEWVRNVLGRDPTEADRRQQWYKDAAYKMRTQEQAQDLYKQFTDYATKETGKGTDLNWMAASQLKGLLTKPTTGGGGGGGGDKTVVTKPTTYAPPGTTNPYGNEFNPGDLTFNNDGTITVTPNIPGRPYGGFTGMDQVRNAYTRGGGSLGYTSPVVKTAAEHTARYDRLAGDSGAAYDYLMGRGANPVESQAATSSTGIMRPYFAGSKKYTPKFLTSNASGVVSSSTTNPNAPASGVTPSAQSINVKTPSGAVVTAFLGSDGTYRTVDGAKYDVTGKPIVAETSTEAANGGLMGYSVGGGLGTLGGYSDGGRLLKGPGDGVSDSIPATIGAKQQPARLADGEFVVPARIVSELGNGSTEAGAKKLYAMMDRVQKARGKTTGKNKVAANPRADKYLPA